MVRIASVSTKFCSFFPETSFNKLFKEVAVDFRSLSI